METLSSEKDYFKVGTVEEPVYSNSAASCLNPEEGGSPQKFLDFFREDLEKKEDKSLEKGKVLHKYQEAPQEFAISEIDKPTDSLAKFTDTLFDVVQQSAITPEILNNVDITLTSTAKKESTVKADILEVRAAYEKLAALLQINPDYCIKIVKLARQHSNAYTSYKDTTLLGKFISEGLAYYKELFNLAGKIPLTKADKYSIEGAISSLKLNPVCNSLLNLSNNIFSNDIQEWKELDIYFEIGGISCKARIDRLEIDHTKRTIKVIDLKSTSKSVYLFPQTAEYYRYYRQIAYYKKAVIEWIKQQVTIGIKGFSIVESAPYTIECYFVVAEMQENFISVPYLVDDAYLVKGTEEAKSLIKRFQYHKKMNMWTMSMEEHINNGILILKEPV